MGSMTGMSVRRSRNFRCVPTSLKSPIFNLEEKWPPRPFGIILCCLELLNCLPDNNLKNQSYIFKHQQAKVFLLRRTENKSKNSSLGKKSNGTNGRAKNKLGLFSHPEHSLALVSIRPQAAWLHSGKVQLINQPSPICFFRLGIHQGWLI